MKLSIWKLLLFAAVTVLACFAILEGVLFLAGVRPVLFDEDPYVGFTSQAPLFGEETGEDGTLQMVTAANKAPPFQEQRFPREKGGNTVRIFSLGGSTTYGRPYDDRTSFSGWLRAYLPVADPTREWEVINAGGVSYASYRVALLMEELIRYDPDIFIIYTGHNEFLERRTYKGIIEMPSALRGIGAAASRTRTFSVLRRAVDSVRDGPGSRIAGADEVLPEEVETILENSIGPSDYTRDDAFKAQVVEHFRFNLLRMADIAQAAGARVVLVRPGSNLRSSTPFKSENRSDMSDAERVAWNGLWQSANRASAAGNWKEAMALADSAIKIDDRHAGLHFLRGEILWHLERYEEAKAAYVRARDEDICPLRILTPMEEVVAAVAEEREIPLVDFRSLAEGRSAHGTPGDEFFLDHVHPTIEGNRLLALSILGTLEREGYVRAAESWGDAAQQRVKAAVEKGFDRAFHGRALRNLARLMRWAGKHDEGYRTALRAVAIIPDDLEANIMVGSNAYHTGRYREAVAFFRKATALNPDHGESFIGLGDALLSMGDFEGAENAFLSALKIDPGLHVAHNNLGNVMLETGRLDEAAGQYREALRLQPDYAQSHHNLGLAAAKRGAFDEAIAHFKRAIEIDGKYGDAYNNLGSAYAAQGKMNEALRQFEAALRIDSGLAEARLNLGSALAESGRHEEAMAHFVEALQIDPDDTEIHLRVARLALEMGDRPSAVAHFSKVAEARPEIVEAPLYLGEMRLGMGDFPEALKFFEKAAKQRPDFPEGYFGAGRAFEGLGLAHEAVEQFEKALGIAPDWGDPAIALARVLAFSRDPLLRDGERAVNLADTVLGRGDRAVIGDLMMLADVYAAMGNAEKAGQTAQIALRQAKESEAAGVVEKIERRMREFGAMEP